MVSALYPDGYLQPAAQHCAQRSTLLRTVNTTSLISIASDVARDSSGRTVAWEADTVPGDKHTHSLSHHAHRLILSQWIFLCTAFGAFFYDSYSYSIPKDDDHIEFVLWSSVPFLK